jgi:hypothetical protein
MAYTTIKKPSDYFNTKLYTGNGGTNNITGVNFQPDWVWIKQRDGTFGHDLYDAIRGATKVLNTNNTSAEYTETARLTAFNADGFSLGSEPPTNGNGNLYTSWNWLGANGTASNTDGSITSTVSANTTSGFSIVSYTGNNTTGATIGHGLGSAPKMIIFKSRSGTKNWITYHDGIGNTKALFLNLTNAEATGSDYWNNTSPTSSVFTLGDNSNHNDTSADMIAYCFSEVKGFSKIGSYVGNGSTDGTFVYTGFKPAWVIQKPIDVVQNWQIHDTKRDGYNPKNDNLSSNNTNSEADNKFIDILSNGFKLRRSDVLNVSGENYIYMAFAEEPLVGDNPATAR